MSRSAEILEQLNTLDEHSTLEAKAGVGSSLLETICAFANEPGLGGGTIILGVQYDENATEPTYRVIGVEQPDKMSCDLASQCVSVFNVPLRPRITTERLDGKNVLIVDVNECESGQKPVFIIRKGLQNGAFRRIGSTDQLCNEDDIALLFGYRNSQPFDQSVVSDATQNDIDAEAIEYYRTLRRRVNPQAEELSYSDTELLQSLRAADSELRPTLTGILLFGKKSALRRLLPAMRIDYIRVPGLQWIDDPHNRFTSIDMRGSLLQLVRRAQDSVYEDLPRKFHLPEGAIQAEGQGIPIDVIREAIVNAVMHASYRVHRPIQIIRYTNRIEITNPGYSLKREDLLGQPGSDLRNPSLATVFHETNLAETKGTGIRTMRRLMNEAGFAPPLFHSDRVNDLFTTTLRLYHFLSIDDLEWLRSLDCDDLTDSQKYALTIVRDTGMIDNSLYRQNSDCDTLRASRELKKLCDLGLLTMRNRGSATFYVPGPKLEESCSNTPKGQPNDGGENGESTKSSAKSTKSASKSSKSAIKSTKLASKSTKSNGMTTNLTEKVELLSDDLKGRISSLRKKEDSDVVLNLIEAICHETTMSTEELAALFGRNPKSLYRDYITVLLHAERLFRVNPSGKTASNQAYTSRKEP